MWGRIKGLKLLRINAYCGGTAAVHKILFYPLCTAACVLRQLCIWLLWLQYTSSSSRGITNYSYRSTRDTAAPQYTRHCSSAACRSSCRSSQNCAAIWVVLYCPTIVLYAALPFISEIEQNESKKQLYLRPRFYS